MTVELSGGEDSRLNLKIWKSIVCFQDCFLCTGFSCRDLADRHSGYSLRSTSIQYELWADSIHYEWCSLYGCAGTRYCNQYGNHRSRITLASTHTTLECIYNGTACIDAPPTIQRYENTPSSMNCS